MQARRIYYHWPNTQISLGIFNPLSDRQLLVLNVDLAHCRMVITPQVPDVVEHLGAASVIASDKTGTLTQNRQTAEHVWVGGAFHTAASLLPAPDVIAGAAASSITSERVFVASTVSKYLCKCLNIALIAMQ